VAPIAQQPLLDRAIGSFAGSHRELAIEIRAGGIEEIFSLLSSEAIDLAIGSTYLVERWADVQTESLTDLRRHFIARRGHPASKLPACTEGELMQFPIVALSDPLSSTIVVDLYWRCPGPQVICFGCYGRAWDGQNLYCSCTLKGP
jgi:DNA-binding transcriptional LysR family regulator